MIDIERVDHVGIRVTDVEKALAFYQVLGFEVFLRVDFDDVIIIKNKQDVEINLITNGNNTNDGKNILMDVEDKFPGYTHAALRVESIKNTIETLRESDIRISQGPVTFGDGHISVFVRDPDLNVIELRSKEQDLADVERVTFYQP